MGRLDAYNETKILSGIFRQKETRAGKRREDYLLHVRLAAYAAQWIDNREPRITDDFGHALSI